MKIRTALILALGLTAAAAQAQNAAPKTKFAEMDGNGDGRITRKEWTGNDVSFAQQDGNGDGVLSGAEVAVSAAPAGSAGGAAKPDRRDAARLERLFKRLDANHDSRLSRQEWQNEKFDRLDDNHDKFVSRDEFMKR